MLTFTHRVDGEECRIYFPERVEDLAGFYEFLQRMGSRPIGLDTETTGLDVYSRSFRCRLVQFGDASEAWVLDFERFEGVIRETLADPSRWYVAHNAPFDLLVLDRVGAAELQELGPRVYDTYILAHLCDPRPETVGGAGLKLKPLSTVYVCSEAADTQAGLNDVFRREYKATKETGWSVIDIDHPVYVTYAGLDVIYVSRLMPELSMLIRQAGMSDLAKWEHRVQMLTTAQQRRGLLVDVEYTERLAEDLQAEAEHFRDVAARYGVENVNSTAQLTAALQAMGEEWPEVTGTGAPSVNGDVLLRMADMDKDWTRNNRRDPNPLADATIRAKRADKWLKSYVVPFLTDRDESDRIHPNIRALAARTGRMSVSHPPLQQLPSSDWIIRRAIIADPGHVIIAADYAQVEMRVLAAMADIPEMKKAIAAGQSIHEFTANMLWPGGYEPWQYKIAKNTGFAKVYGGGAATISKTSGSTLEEVKPIIRAYDEAFPEIFHYGRTLQRRAAARGNAVYTPIGRRLPLDRERAYAATNYMVQSTSRDLLAQALCRIDDAGMSDVVLLPVHDELLGQAPVDDAEDVAREMGRLMESTFEGVPIASEAEVYGPSWGHGYGAAA